MGGALATLMSPDMLTLLELLTEKITGEFIKPRDLTLWTFGAPNVGNRGAFEY